jgi:hypothetical protein
MLGALATLLVLLATGGTPAADSSVSMVKAHAMAEKLAALEKRATLAPPRRAPVSVSDAEINSYVNLARPGDVPKGLSDARVRFGRDRLTARGLLDLEQVRERIPVPESLKGLLGLLSGKVPVEVGGRLRNLSEGVVTFAADDAHVAMLPVPVTVMERLAAWVTTSADHPQGVDIHSPFRLPYALKRVRLEPGRALLD